MGSSAAPGSSYGTGKQAAAAAKHAAGRAALAIGSGLLSGSRLIAKGVRAALADNSDKEAIRFLKFAELEWSADGSGQDGSLGSSGSSAQRRLPVLLVGLATGFQVWRLDGANPAELVSRRDGPVKLLEALPQPRCSGDEEACDALFADRPLLAVVPAAEPGTTLGAAGRPTGAGAVQQAQREQQQHIVQLYSLRSHGFCRTLSFSSEVLALQASGRLLVVALRGQLQAFDAATLQHTFSCLTYVPPPPPRQLSRSGSGAAGRRQPAQPHQFVTEGLTSSTSSAGSEAGYYQQAASSGTAGDAAAAQAPVAALAPFALGPRWLAYAADTPVPATSGQAVAQRLPLARRDSSSSRVSGAAEGEDGSGPGGLTRAAVADAALQAAAKGGQQLRAGLAAVGSASFRYLSQQYSSWRQGPLDQAQQQREADAIEADAAVAGTVVVRDAATRLVLAHFRAHTSPLAALQFSPCGRLLATASTAGHSINVFRVLPPPPQPGSAAGEEGAFGSGLGGPGSMAGQAVWLYRLYRGVTPAAIRGIAFAPDASWVAVSSGRGTTHLFHTPALAPGAGDAAAAHQQQQQPGAAAAETGVLGCPPKQAAAGRARKPGLLSGGMAGAATSAARNLYAGQPADVEPIAAAFLPSGPGSPKAVAPAASGSGGSLYVVTSDGLLTRHLLLAPAAAAAGTATAATSAAAQGASSVPALERQDSAAAAAAGAAAAVLEEADRWDVARQGSWPEREELLPGLLGSSPMHPTLSAAEQQQLWVAQAECGALSAEGADGGGSAAGAAPLWRDSQFRCYEIQVQGLHVASAAPTAAAADADLDGPEGLAARLQAADLSGSGGGHAPWLEDLPAQPIEQ